MKTYQALACIAGVCAASVAYLLFTSPARVSECLNIPETTVAIENYTKALRVVGDTPRYMAMVSIQQAQEKQKAIQKLKIPGCGKAFKAGLVEMADNTMVSIVTAASTFDETTARDAWNGIMTLEQVNRTLSYIPDQRTKKGAMDLYNDVRKDLNIE